MISNQKKTKILVTAGPALDGSSSKDKILNYIKSGANMFRFNFSHGSYEEHLIRLNNIKSVLRDNNLTGIKILGDIKGPKMRIGEVDETDLRVGDECCFYRGEKPSEKAKSYIPLDCDSLYSDKINDKKILLADGAPELKIFKVTKDFILAEVLVEGTVSSRKGITVVDYNVEMPFLSDKDKEDIAFVLKNDFDGIMCSFVNNHKDVESVYAIMEKCDRYMPIFAKIETPQAMENLESIVEMADGLVVARGDLCLRCDRSSLGLNVNRIIREARLQEKPIIYATQTMIGMMNMGFPARSEICDITNVVLKGVDIVMLSEESAMCEFGHRIIKELHDVLTTVESSTEFWNSCMEGVDCLSQVEIFKAIAAKEDIISNKSEYELLEHVMTNKFSYKYLSSEEYDEFFMYRGTILKD